MCAPFEVRERGALLHLRDGGRLTDARALPTDRPSTKGLRRATEHAQKRTAHPLSIVEAGCVGHVR